mgnify:CR=1 FL=1
MIHIADAIGEERPQVHRRPEEGDLGRQRHGLERQAILQEDRVATSQFVEPDREKAESLVSQS